MYINTFKYTPKDVSCQLCTEYVKKLGCTALRCPWLAERIEAGVVGYREAVLETFPHERRLFQRLNLLIKHYPGSLWSNEQHERRMQYQCAVQGYRRRRDTNAYYAAMYLLTSNDDIYRRTANCFCKDGIEFGYRHAAFDDRTRYAHRHGAVSGHRHGVPGNVRTPCQTGRASFPGARHPYYTVMCNHHLKDSNLSLKAKGLLSMMLSLPDEWNYTARGLAAICKEGVDAIGKTLKELELAGYIIRRQLRGKDGRISDTEYTIFEKPRKPSPPDATLPDTENPYLDNPDTEAPDTDNPAQLNTKKSNTQKSNTDLSSTHSFFLPAADGMTDGLEKKAKIREQIEYDILCQQYDRMQLDELVEIMLEVAMNRSPTVKIGRDAEYPTGFVQQRFEKITSMHIEKVMDGIRENTTRVWNTKAYLMAVLFNSVSTIDNHYAMLVNHDFHGGP